MKITYSTILQGVLKTCLSQEIESVTAQTSFLIWQEYAKYAAYLS